MRTNKKVMTGALLLFMMMAANFHNALNDYGIRSNAFMNGVIASGSNGSGSDGWFDNWDAEYPTCTYYYTDYIFISVNSTDPIPEGYHFHSMSNGWMCYQKLVSDDGTKRVCKDGSGLCLWNDQECCPSRTLGICTD